MPETKSTPPPASATAPSALPRSVEEAPLFVAIKAPPTPTPASPATPAITPTVRCPVHHPVGAAGSGLGASATGGATGAGGGGAATGTAAATGAAADLVGPTEMGSVCF